MTTTPTSGAADLRATFSEMLVDLPNTEPLTLFKAGFDAALAAGQATAAPARDLAAVIKGAADKLDAAVRCHPNAVDTLIHEALEILDGDREPDATPASHGQAPAGAALSDELRSMIEGMSVSVDVSTGDHDAGHRYFGTVTEVMECQGDKHGGTLLVQDAEPNFPAQPAPGVESNTAGATPVNPHWDYLKRYWQMGFDGASLGACTGDAPIKAWHQGRAARESMTFPTAQADSVPSRFGSPELQAMILARCVEKDQADSVLEDAARWREHVGKLDALVAYCPTCCQGFIAKQDMTRDEVLFACGKAVGQSGTKRLREALDLAVDHIDMDALRISHCKDAAVIDAAMNKGGAA